MFKQAAPIYQEALNRSGHKYKLEYKPPNPKNKKAKSRNKLGLAVPSSGLDLA